MVMVSSIQQQCDAHRNIVTSIASKSIMLRVMGLNAIMLNVTAPAFLFVEHVLVIIMWRYVDAHILTFKARTRSPNLPSLVNTSSMSCPTGLEPPNLRITKCP